MGNNGYFVYNDTEPKIGQRGGGFKIGDPNPKYIMHYGNYLLLTKACKQYEGLLRFQAEKELAICEKKLEWWSKRPGFSLRECLKAIQVLKRDWEMPDLVDPWSH